MNRSAEERSVPEGRAGTAVTWPVSTLPSHRQLRMRWPGDNAGDRGIKNVENNSDIIVGLLRLQEGAETI